MEREMSHIGIDIRSPTSPPVIQHQFFPAGGNQPSHAINEYRNGRLYSAGGEKNIGEEVVTPPHWNMKTWNWDPVQFVAQRASGRGERSFEDQRQSVIAGNGESHRVSGTGLKLDRPSAREESNRVNEEDEREERDNSFFERETPSPPFNDRQRFPGDEDSEEAVGSLSLKLGGDSYAYGEENEGGSRNGKRNRSSSPASQVPACQVDGCKADLCKTKDYYRRHKVCEMHSKATKAPVSRLMQRFCQQCSRFHPLQEFDEGRRSCRRRLAGHNRRRRKTQPDAAAARALLMSEEERLSNGNSGLVGSLLNILSQLTGTTPLPQFNAPVFDREALLRKSITASLEEINRTTPLWTQLLTNPHLLASAFGQQVQQPAASNNHETNVVMEAQRLLSRLTGPSPEALIALLQQSLNAQVAAAPVSTHNNLVSHMYGANINGHFTPGSTSRSEAQVALPRSTQACVEPISAGVSHPILSSPMSDRAPALEEVGRPTPMVPMPLPQMSSAQSVQPGVAPDVQSSFVPYQAPIVSPPTKNHACNGAATSSRSPTLPDMGQRESLASMNGLSSASRREMDNPQHVRKSSRNLQSRSVEQLPSSSNANAERKNRTRHIAMKLFERTPEELPLDLRYQIDSWLAHLPSDMESYIRPGCLVLTIFVSMPTSGWAELDTDLQASVQKLLNLCKDDFWHRGRILVQVERQMVLIVDGEIREKRLVNSWDPYIQSVRPLAVEAGQAATITLKGFNLTAPDTRVLCAYQGKYLVEESDLAEGTSNDTEEDEMDNSIDHPADYTLFRNDETSLFLDVKFTSSEEHPHAVGRCFLEVEHGTTLANARPVIIADRLVCSELCTLDEEVEVAASYTNQAAVFEDLLPVEVLGCCQVTRLIIEEDITCFLHELGWYFQTGICWQEDEPFTLDVVSATRLKCLLIFSVERSWCAVVRKLLDIALSNQSIDTGVARLSQVVQDDFTLLHRAVRRKSRGMVDLLLAYVPSSISSRTVQNVLDTERIGNLQQFKSEWGNLFRPDMTGPAGLTPLHIAASMQDGEDIVDALTSDPFQVGLQAWLNKRDDSGHTPLDCAMAIKNFKSVQLVKAKLAALEGSRHQVRIDILSGTPLQTWDQGSPGDVQGGTRCCSSVQLAEWVDSGSVPAKNISRKSSTASCRIHARGTHFGGIRGRAFRPFLLSLVAIATICVCVCVVIRSPPNVLFVTQPFRWEGVDSGPK